MRFRPRFFALSITTASSFLTINNQSFAEDRQKPPTNFQYCFETKGADFNVAMPGNARHSVCHWAPSHWMSMSAEAEAKEYWSMKIERTIRRRVLQEVRSVTGSGVTIVRFVVSPSGRVEGASVVRSSGSRDFDNAALLMVRTPMPAAPNGYAGPQMSITVPLRFGAGSAR